MHRLIVCLLPLLLSLLAGCNSEGAAANSVKAVVPVSGKIVAKDGSPVKNAWIVCHAQDVPGNDATAESNDDGSFHLGTFGKQDGAIPGKYIVTIQTHPHKKNGTPIPGKFTSAQTSPVRIEVTKGAANELSVIRLQ